MRSFNSAEAEGKSDHQDWTKVVQEAVSTLRFGVVQLVIHDGKVVQIEKTEKFRIGQQS